MKLPVLGIFIDSYGVTGRCMSQQCNGYGLFEGGASVEEVIMSHLQSSSMPHGIVYLDQHSFNNAGPATLELNVGQ